MKSKLKPWMLVNVRYPHGGCCPGETVSFPTPEGTIMVRRVPGMAGTMDEVPLDRISTLGVKRITIHYAAVAGPGNRLRGGFFPVDMLRYDGAVPVNFSIDEEGRAVPEIEGDELIVANVSTVSRRAFWTKDRWGSFLWSLREIKSEQFIEGESK